MKNSEIIKLLDDTGHIEFPFGKQRTETFHAGHELTALQLTDSVIAEGIASYQDFNVLHLEPLCMAQHKRPARCDGEIGPATHELFGIERCGYPDYGKSVLPATGNGSWKNCHKIGDFHAATVKVHKKGISSALDPVYEQIWVQVAAAFDAMGLRLIRTEDDDANIDAYFETGRTGWIGLAQVAHDLACKSKLWCKYSSRYLPTNLVKAWVILLLHELFHNCGGQHTRNGIMSPYIITSLEPTWIGDPSEPIIRRMFGGEPIDPTPPPTPGKRYAIVQHYHVNDQGVAVAGEQWEMKPRPEVGG